MVPISSPLAAFVILPGISMLKTIIGILLSLHNVVDVESITFNSFVIMSLYVNSSNLTALGFVLGQNHIRHLQISLPLK